MTAEYTPWCQLSALNANVSLSPVRFFFKLLARAPPCACTAGKEAHLTPGAQLFKAFEDVDLGALKALPPRGEGRVRYFIGGGMQAVSALAELQGQKAKFRKDEAERGVEYATKEMNMGIFMCALPCGACAGSRVGIATCCRFAPLFAS